MPINELMTVATFDEWEDAERLRLRFDGAGIGAEILNESAEQRYLLFSEPHSAMRVRVGKDSAERANELMRKWDAEEGILAKAPCCPECGSYAVEYPQFSRKTYQSVFFAMLTALHFMRRLYYCQQCHFTWSPLPPPEPKKLDILNWSIPEPKKSKS